MVTTRRGATTGSDQSPDLKTSSSTPSSSLSASRTPPYLPTPLERICLAIFPAILLFGTIFSAINPQTRAATFDATAQAYSQDPTFAPNYFARKSNIFNVIFVKRGWGWTSGAFAFFLFMHPSAGPVRELTQQRIKALGRWVAVTAWWFFVTQWFFGPPIIDRGFRWTGGKCDVAELETALGVADAGDVITAVACKAVGGKWRGGHDISGHVFLLVLCTAFLMQEVGWPIARWSGWNREERCIVMADGALKSASVEAEIAQGEGKQQTWLGIGGRTALGVMGLNLWMLLMTAIYFHTWFEKVTGLVTASLAIYSVYYVPRFVAPLRQVLGVPGI